AGRLQGPSEGCAARARPSRLPADRARRRAGIVHGVHAVRRGDRRALVVVAAGAADLPAAGARGRIRLGAGALPVGTGARGHAQGLCRLRRGVRVSAAQLRSRIPEINSWLLAAVFFCIPLQVAPAYVLTAAMLVLWLVDGRLPEKFRVLAGEPMVWIMAGYHGVMLASMLWTDDVDWGWRMIKRNNFFLLFPLYFSVARREHFGRYVTAFLASIALCEALAFYNWAQLHLWPELPAGVRVEKDPFDTAPFVDRIMYAPLLALAGYLAGHRLLFEAATARWRLVYAGLMVATAINLLIAGGRTGLVGFLVLLALLVFQRAPRRPLAASLLSAALIGSVVLGGYYGSSYFRERVHDAVQGIVDYDKRPELSASQRIVFVVNAWRI